MLLKLRAVIVLARLDAGLFSAAVPLVNGLELFDLGGVVGLMGTMESILCGGTAIECGRCGFGRRAGVSLCVSLRN